MLMKLKLQITALLTVDLVYLVTS